LIPRSVAQVGLGTARNFHSSRPIFQNLVENVPIAGRAFYEADWDVKMRREKENMLRSVKKEKKSASKPKALKISQSFAKVPTPLLEKENDTIAPSSQQLDHYFPDPTPAVITTLLIPLAPTPTARMPLSARTQDQQVLPWREIMHLHNMHSTHALRVSSLFSRLDAANVWERGVRCSAFSHGNDPSHNGDAICTILQVEFVGWSKAEVRSVIGESGTGWCVLEESWADDEDDIESIFSESTYPEEPVDDHVTQSFVFPTLDLSATAFSLPPPSSRPPSSTPLIINSPTFDSTFEWGSSFSSSEHSIIEPPTLNGYFGFSFSFAERMSEAGWEDLAETRDHLF